MFDILFFFPFLISFLITSLSPKRKLGFKSAVELFLQGIKHKSDYFSVETERGFHQVN